jgi:hypothetical protein
VELKELIDQEYIPTEVERKKAVMMYFLIWILFWLNSKKKTKYILFHLKQAIGWWFIFFTFLVIFSFFFFIPFIRLIPILIFFVLLAIWIRFVYQARNWKYTTDDGKIVLPIFFGLGNWILTVFDIETSDDKINK